MATVTETGEVGVADAATAWLEAFEQALRLSDRQQLETLFLEETYWRDLVSLTWDSQQFWGHEAVVEALAHHGPTAGVAKLRIDEDRSAPQHAQFLGHDVIEVFFTYETNVGSGKGFARLEREASSPVGLRALMVATALVALDCAPELEGRHPWRGFDPAFPGQTWREWSDAKSDFSERDPDVLIIGGSQAGLSVGARFERKGISYLIVERNEKPGDEWRNRYDALVLHTPTWMNDLPYIPLPRDWSRFTPKDQWADWLDCYATLMNLNFWGSTEARKATFDTETRTWEVTLRLGDGTERIMRPKHVVLAIGGVGGKPRMPDLAGLEAFEGEVLHSTSFENGSPFAGQRVMVIGASTTAHDIALDLFHRGARPVMAQRGPACVVNISETLAFTADYETMDTDEADQRRSAMPLPLMVRMAQAATVRSEETHAGLHDGLRRAGQRLTTGEDKTGWIMRLFRDVAGYYLNVGASEAIVEGDIEVLDFSRIEQVVPEGVQLDDGTVEHFDTIVCCTGYEDLSADIEWLVGPEAAERIGQCVGVADDGEYRAMSRVLAHPHLWVITGGIVDARKSSDLLALQVIAQMEGLVPSLLRQPDGTVAPL